MIASEGILTSRGGKTSHAAVVARGMGKTCVCGAEELDVDTKRRRMTVGETVIEEGDVVSIDGSTGKVYLGEVPVVPSPVVEYFEGRMHAGADDADELVAAVHRIMAYADRVRRLRVRANADNAEDALRARRFGAQGIGLCRTEHMFLGERRELVERLILADTDDEREAALSALLPLQKKDFVELFEAMDGLPVTVRLLDPPLHEFLPDITELSVRVALAESRKDANENDLRLLQAVHKLHEQNPMLGLRGVRLGLVIPGLFKMQVRAIAEAAAERKNAKGDPRAEIMVPLVGTVQELEIVREEADQVIAEVEAATGTNLKLTIGTMIELPRAALTAGQIAEAAQFFSFGTNDLTQTVWASPATTSRPASSPRTWRRASSGSRRSRPSTATASARWSAAPSRPAGPPAPTSSSASAASTAATRSRCTSSTRSASTTSPARPSGSRWRAWRRAARPPRRRAPTAAEPRRTGPAGPPDCACPRSPDLRGQARLLFEGGVSPHIQRSLYGARRWTDPHPSTACRLSCQARRRFPVRPTARPRKAPTAFTERFGRTGVCLAEYRISLVTPLPKGVSTVAERAW